MCSANKKKYTILLIPHLNISKPLLHQLTSKTMVAQTFAFVGTGTINATHWTSIGRTIWSDKTIVALTFTIFTIAMTRTYQRRVVRWAFTNITRKATPSWHACAFPVVANTMARTLFGAKSLTTIFANVTLVALAFHIDTCTFVGTGIGASW
jgi:hypothetical protein